MSSSSSSSSNSNADSIRVYCRFRPLNAQEKDTMLCVQFDGDTVTMPATGHKFTFDRIFPPTTPQSEIFEVCGKQLVENVMAGYNATVLAYGQTGSGKTHTMTGVLGDTEQQGLLPRLVQSIWDRIAEADPQLEFTISASFVEIYMEVVKDLLTHNKPNLRVREGPQGVFLEDVTTVFVSSVQQVIDLLHAGNRLRAIAATKMNDHSSRSHSIFIMTVVQTHMVTAAKKTSRLYVVDLAGSERASKTGAEGQTLNEAKHINKSLHQLGMVINALTEGRMQVPYRDSKLTFLLRDSLGGNSKTSLIITCSPSTLNAEETLSTLRFGLRAKTVKNKAKINQELGIGELKAMLAAAEKRIAQLQQIIEALEKEIAELKAGRGEGSGSTSKEVIQKLQGQVAELEEKLAKLQDHADGLQDQIAEKEQLIEKLTAHVAKGASTVAELRKDLLASQQRQQQLEDQLSEMELLKKQLALVEKEREEAITKLHEMEQENAAKLAAATTEPSPPSTPVSPPSPKTAEQQQQQQQQQQQKPPPLTRQPTRIIFSDLSRTSIEALRGGMGAVLKSLSAGEPVTKREKELARLTEELLADLQRKCEQHLQAHVELEEMRQLLAAQAKMGGGPGQAAANTLVSLNNKLRAQVGKGSACIEDG